MMCGQLRLIVIGAQLDAQSSNHHAADVYLSLLDSSLLARRMNGDHQLSRCTIHIDDDGFTVTEPSVISKKR